MNAATLEQALRERAIALGFGAFGIAPATASPLTVQRLRDWLQAGYHGDMIWMADAPERRADPSQLWPEVRSVIMLGVNYGTESDVLARVDRSEQATIALYAQRRDYHEVIKGRLKELAGFLAARGGSDVKVFVDTAPVLEKTLAQAAGLGWQGKNTMLISRNYGTWLFLGAIYTTYDFEAASPVEDSCGSCKRCLQICPTEAFPQPYVLDARRCISYLTIEHKGPIPRQFRAKIGNRVFGCDDCLAVCPWNKFARESRDARLAMQDRLDELSLAGLVELNDDAFRKLFAGTPIKRTGRDRFLRNVLIAIGNSRSMAYLSAVERRLADASPLVRGAAVWALAQITPEAEFHAVRPLHETREMDADVRAEWALAEVDQ